MIDYLWALGLLLSSTWVIRSFSLCTILNSSNSSHSFQRFHHRFFSACALFSNRFLQSTKSYGLAIKKNQKHFNDIHINAVRDIKTYSISAIESSVCPRIKNLTSFTAAEHMHWSISSSSLVSIISISVSRRNPSQKASDLQFTTTERTPSWSCLCMCMVRVTWLPFLLFEARRRS